MGFGKKKSQPAATPAPAPVAPVPVDATITRADPGISQSAANLQARSEENKSATLLQTKDDEELKKRQEASIGVA
jgi:hypothetical protein